MWLSVWFLSRQQAVITWAAVAPLAFRFFGTIHRRGENITLKKNAAASGRKNNDPTAERRDIPERLHHSSFLQRSTVLKKNCHGWCCLGPVSYPTLSTNNTRCSRKIPQIPLSTRVQLCAWKHSLPPLPVSSGCHSNSLCVCVGTVTAGRGMWPLIMWRVACLWGETLLRHDCMFLVLLTRNHTGSYYLRAGDTCNVCVCVCLSTPACLLICFHLILRWILVRTK